MRTSYIALAVLIFTFACARGTTQFGQACSSTYDCQSGYCVSGEGPVHQLFCSDDCGGKAAGEACGGTQGACDGQHASWCWRSCATDGECAELNPERPYCVQMSVNGVHMPFRACGVAKGQAL